MKPVHAKPALAPAHAARLPLAALQAFAVAARTASFKLAAEALFRTPSAVSHQVRELETSLGTPLFERGHRSVALTPAGRALARVVQRSFTQMQQALEATREAATRQQPALVMSMAPGFAATYVLPRWRELQAQVPGWRLELESTAERADLGGGRVMLAVRFCPPPRPPRGSGVAAQLLLADPSLVVAAPRLFTARGALRGGVGRATLLSLAAQPRLWAQVLAEQGLVHEGNHLSFDSQTSLMEACEQGLGLALTPASVVREKLARRSLQAVPGIRLENNWGYWLLARSGKAPPATCEALARVAAWLQQAVSAVGSAVGSAPRSAAPRAPA